MKGEYKEILGVLLQVERSERRLRKLGGAGDSGKVDVTLRENESVKAPTEMGQANSFPKLRFWKLAAGMRRLLSSEVVDADKLDEPCEPVIGVRDDVASCRDNARPTSDLC